MAVGRIRGTVCRVLDLRVPDACTAVVGVTIQVRALETGDQDLTDANGRFELVARDDAPVTVVTNADPAVWFDGARRARRGQTVSLPILARDDLFELVGANAATQPPGTGLLVLRVLAAGAPAAGAFAGTVVGASAPFYDAGDPVFLDPNGPTGPAGTIVFFGAPDGDVTVSVSLGGETRQVETFASADRITFQDVSF